MGPRPLLAKGHLRGAVRIPDTVRKPDRHQSEQRHYVNRFEKYSGETLTVTKTVVKKAGDVIVFTQISRSEGVKPINVDWRVRTDKGEYKIVDVIVEGISMGQTQRSEFASVIRQTGGKVKGLIEKLRK